MTKLVVGHVWTRIEDGAIPDPILSKAMSFRVKGTWFSPAYRKGLWDGIKRYWDHRTDVIRFPSGLIDRLTDQLDKHEWPYTLDDQRDYPVSAQPVFELEGSDGPVRLDRGKWDYQAEVVEKAVAACRGTVVIPTGGGKSNIIAAITKSFGVRTLIVVHRLQLLQQMRDVLTERLGRHIGQIGDGVKDFADVTVGMIQTIDHQANEKHDDIRLWLKGVECVIFDECHHLGSADDQWYRNALKLQAPYRYGLTATPTFEQYGMQTLAVTGGVVAKVELEELLRRGVLVPPRIWFHEIATPILDKKMKGQAVYKAGVVENEIRNEMAVSSVVKFKAEGKRTLILVKRVGHGRALLELMCKHNITADFIEGKVSEDNRDLMLAGLKAGLLDCLIAMVSILGEGTDLPWLTACINATGAQGGGENDDDEGRLNTQMLGRGSRSFPGKTHFDYVDFVDLTHKSLKAASTMRLETYVALGYGDRINYWRDYRA